MQITFSPQLRFDAVAYSVSGTTLTCNDVATDITGYTYDPEAPHDWIVGQPVQDGDEWQVTVILPIGPDATEAARFPEPVTVTDGAVTLPA